MLDARRVRARVRSQHSFTDRRREPYMPEPRPVFRMRAGEWITLAALAVLGLVTLPQPFAWDQAMFTLGARKLAAGAALYRDYWDPKQPAMFALYWLGGLMFGFHEVGVHLF